MTDPVKHIESGPPDEDDPTHRPAAGPPSPKRGGMETAAPPCRNAAGRRRGRLALRLRGSPPSLPLSLRPSPFRRRRVALAAEPAADIPAWLAAHVGDGNGEIAPVVLQRARALYLQKVAAGAVKNPCYFAMDATRPNTASDGRPGLRFYIICEASQSFRAISSGHGAGRNLRGVAELLQRPAPARRTSATRRTRA